MQLSYFSDYSLRVMMYAALHEGAFQLDDVAKAYGISRHHLGKVVQNLARLGHLKTRRGRGGGIQLAVPAGRIRLGELVRATEDQPVIVECFDPVKSKCVLGGSCLLKGILGEARSSFYATLDRHTLSDLVSGPQRSRMKQILIPQAG
jgi:Rrf2 family nitric oxide-sensitive transcriptional repressor